MFQKGERHFRLLKRVGNVALYDMRLTSSPTVDWSKPATAWEVVIIRQVLTGRKIGDYYMPPHEELPSDAQWGNRGWSPGTLEDAEARFSEVAARFSK